MNSTIIGLVGFAGSGKDTVANYLVNNYSFTQLSFAGSLKIALAEILDWDQNFLMGLTPESRKWRDQVDEWWANRLGIPDFTPRKAMQLFGTDVMRHHFHEDIWVAGIQRKIQRLVLEDKSVVISDCRHPNEIKILKEAGGLLLEVCASYTRERWHKLAVAQNLANEQDLAKMKQQGLTMENLWPEVHSSEWAWIGHRVAGVIENMGSLEQLYTKIDATMASLNIKSR